MISSWWLVPMFFLGVVTGVFLIALCSNKDDRK